MGKRPSKSTNPDQPFYFEEITYLLDSRIKDRADEIDPADEQSLKVSRSQTTKDFYKALKETIHFVEHRRKADLYYRKEDLFPPQWMKADKRIKGALERVPSFIPLINYIHNRNRYWRGDKLKAMMEEADKITGGRRHDKHLCSTFVLNQALEKELIDHLEISRVTLYRTLAISCEIGYLKLSDGRGKGKQALYADGYFLETPDNQVRKISFVMNTPSIKANLRLLPEFLTKYRGSR